MSKKQSARSSKAFTSSTPSGVGGFGGFDTASSFSSASASQLSYVTPPPDLKGISDSSVVVLFKNLSKKDETTKAKALEDLQAVTDVEDATIAAWVLLYPRLSTDTSRRVRALSHTVHGLVSQRAGKRIAEYMPRVIGAWLAGLYDSDRATSKAANDSLKLVFASEEKIARVWKVYQTDILKYCTNVVLNETAGTLSDERQVSPDDAQNKFARVIATSVLALGNLISILSQADLEKEHDSYSAVISDPRLWSFSYHSDSYLRKALYRFLILTLTPLSSVISSPETLPTVSEAIITKSLAKSQIGSAIDYLDALISLTSAFPASWTVLKPSKKRTPIGMLIKFIKSGSQTAGPEYWRKLVNLISVLPLDTLPKSLDGFRELLAGLIDGICNGPEPRTNLASAWGSYFSITYYLLSLEGGDADESAKVIEESMWPIYRNYMTGNTDETEKLRIPHYAAAICAGGVAMAGAHDERIIQLIIEGVWSKAENLLFERIVKGDTEGMGQRWVDLSAEILEKTKEGNQLAGVVKDSNVNVLVQCISAVVSEKGKSGDMPLLLEQILLNFGSSVLGVEKAQQATGAFFAESLPDLILSPSLPQLLSTLIAYGTHTPDLAPFQMEWKKTIRSILLSSLSKETKEACIIQLLQSTSTSLQKRVPLVTELEHYVTRKLETSLETDEAVGWEMMKLAFGSSILSEGTLMKMISILSDGLSLQKAQEASPVCKHLAIVAKQNPQVLTSFAISKNGADMLYRLLLLVESPDGEVSVAAKSIYKVIESGLAASSAKIHAEVVGNVVEIISRSVREPKDVELSLHALAENTKVLINRAPGDEKVALVERLLFTPELWKHELDPFLTHPVMMSLAITNPIGGAIFFADNPETPYYIPVRDRQGVSVAMRMGIFTVQFLKAMDSFNRAQDNIFSQISEDSRITLFYYLALTLELATDNVGIYGANYLWAENSPEAEQEALELVYDTQEFITSCFEHDDLAGYLSVVIERLIEHSVKQQSASTSAFYSARVLSGVIGGLADRHKVTPEQAQTWLKSCDVRRSTDVFRVTALLTGLSEILEHSKDADRLRNELASDLMGVPISKCKEEGLRKLIFLNAVLPKRGEDVAPIPPQRTILLIKHLISWFGDKESETEPNTAVITEAMKIFTSVLPTVKDLYGEHWESLCELVSAGLSNPIAVEECTPLVFASLKLFQTLKSIRLANDDIEDAWNTTALEFSLKELLRNSTHADDQHQPMNLCNDLMARQIKLMDLQYFEDPSEIYPLLNVRSGPVQEAAFEILHRYIPSTQENVSIEAALSKEDNFTLQLPMELLSLIMEPPTMDQVEDWDFEKGMPLTLRGYLLTWILIFDHFENSSFKVRSAYVENLKEGGYLTGLLDFTFDFLGHTKGRPIDASKFDIESYTLNLEDSPLKDTQWLLIHLYYLSLRCTPSLSRSWWMDCKVRQKVLSVESFTEKYMSPLIIDKEFAAVRAWIAEQPAPAPGEGEGMQVKISRGTTKEILAVYPIDDQTMEMVVRLPSIFPLKQVEVEGVRKVGLSGQQFKKMQLASLAVINFQSASIIDGLTLFRKNVSLLLQGVAECAICYSILAVTPDRSLPNKTCSTCKNKFHSSCLLKWFKTSNSSSCPLCRTSFSFYS